MKKLIIISVLLFSVSVCSQVVNKVMISGSMPSHDTDVKNAFLMGYASYDGTQFSGTVDLHTDYSSCGAITYAHQNNYQVVVRSYTGLNQTVNDSAKNHPELMLFMPAGSNSYTFVCNLDIPNSSVVSTGAGNDSLVTGYKVEFYSIDPITTSNLSSFSNGYIAGQIAFIANHFNISLSQARVLARQNSENNNHSVYVQYGQIDIIRAVSSLPVELVSFDGSSNGGKVTLNWRTSTEVNNFGFYVQRKNVDNENAGEWETVGFAKGLGNSNAPNDYIFFDQPEGGTKFEYRLKQQDNDGKFKYYAPLSVSLVTQKLPELMQNNPNPFNPSTQIKFFVPVNSYVTIKIYDISGKEVSTLINNQTNAGYHIVYWNGKDKFGKQASSGMYVYRLTANSSDGSLNKIFVDTKKMLLVK